MAKNDLSSLILTLIEEDGLTEEEARDVAVATIKARRGQVGLSRNPHQQDSVQNHPNRVNYGNETPAQAQERWLAQEMADPNGVFGGGASAGGVFGDGPVILDNFDPLAVKREMEMRSQLAGMTTQREMVELLREMRQELRGEKQLPKAENAFGRRLGKKKR